jgi:hypothetical protein
MTELHTSRAVRLSLREGTAQWRRCICAYRHQFSLCAHSATHVTVHSSVWFWLLQITPFWTLSLWPSPQVESKYYNTLWDPTYFNILISINTTLTPSPICLEPVTKMNITIISPLLLYSYHWPYTILQ